MKDEGGGVSVDGLGNIFISGLTAGSLSGQNLGGSDAFVAKIIEVPEPTALLLLGLGVVAVLCLRCQHIRAINPPF